jgi:hypothetical protein
MSLLILFKAHVAVQQTMRICWAISHACAACMTKHCTTIPDQNLASFAGYSNNDPQSKLFGHFLSRREKIYDVVGLALRLYIKYLGASPAQKSLIPPLPVRKPRLSLSELTLGTDSP